MWFFRSFRYLPPPTFLSWAPTLFFLLVFWTFQDLPLQVLGVPISVLGVAVVSGYALALARGLPAALVRSGEAGVRREFLIVLLVTSACAVATLFAPADRIVQTGGTIAWVLVTLTLALVVLTSSDSELSELPFRWAEDHPFCRTAMTLIVLRFAIETAVAASLVRYGSLADWVLFISLGRFLLYYLVDWITVLMVMTSHDEDC